MAITRRDRELGAVETTEELQRLLSDPRTEINDVWVDYAGRLCIVGNAVYGDGWQSFTLAVTATALVFMNPSTRTEIQIRS